MFAGRIVFCSLYYCKAIGNTDNVYSKPVKTSITHHKTQNILLKTCFKGCKTSNMCSKVNIHAEKHLMSTVNLIRTTEKHKISTENLPMPTVKHNNMGCKTLQKPPEGR